jgi:hypothetical protein
MLMGYSGMGLDRGSMKGGRGVMARCSAITSKGSPCRNAPTTGSDYCQAHSPERADARRRAASIAGRSKPGTEIHAVKKQLRQLASDVLTGKVNTAKGSVASQVLGIWLRAVEVEIKERDVVVREGELALKVKEQEELQTRLEELEAAVEASQERARQKGAGYGYTG